MTKTIPQNIGERFERASRELFKRILPRLGFEVRGEPRRQKGSGQYGYDLAFETRPQGAGITGLSGLTIRFYVECKGATKIEPLNISQFGAKPEQLHQANTNPDYWILFSPLKYIANEFDDSLSLYRSEYPFALVDYTRPEGKEKDKNGKPVAGIYIDLFKHYPDIFDIFKQDIPEDLRDSEPQTTQEEILGKLKQTLKDAYGDYRHRAVQKGIIEGVRRITPHTVSAVKSEQAAELEDIRKSYFTLDSTNQTLLAVVCGDAVIRNPELEERICRAVEDPLNLNASIAVLGSEDCGKSTLQYRMAVDFALKDYPVLGLDASGRSLIAGSIEKKDNIAVAEVLLDVHKQKRGPKERHGHFTHGYWDLEQYMDRMELGELRDIMTYVFAVYTFGFSMPVTLVKRLLRVTDDGFYLPVSKIHKGFERKKVTSSKRCH